MLAVPMLIGISLVTFVFVGAWLNPLWQALGPTRCTLTAQVRGPCSEAIKQTIRYYHLQDHLVPRWWFWVEGIFTGHSGTPITSTRAGRPPIWPQVGSATAHTAILMALAVVVVLVCSVAVGTFAARRAGRPSDIVARSFAYVTWSVPAFALAILLQELVARLAAAYGFHALYAGGVPGPEAGTGLHYVGDWLRHLALPVIALSAGAVGGYSRYVRSGMLVALHAPYAVAARARGVTETRITIRHALPNSLIPLLNVVALDFGAIFGASLAVDYVFGLQGLGSYLKIGLFNSDPYEVEPVVVITAAAVLLSRVLADLVTRQIDPRVGLA